MLQHGWTSKMCLVKEARHKRFHLYGMSRNGRSTETERILGQRGAASWKGSGHEVSSWGAKKTRWSWRMHNSANILKIDTSCILWYVSYSSVKLLTKNTVCGGGQAGAGRGWARPAGPDIWLKQGDGYRRVHYTILSLCKYVWNFA